MMKKISVFFMLLMLLFPAARAVGDGVTITAGQPAYTETGFTADIDVQFYDRALYNDQVLLSYHIYGEDGEMLVAENQRIAFELNDQGTATVPVTVACADLPELAEIERALVQFDLVDQKNAFWFSGNDSIGFQTASITFDRSLLHVPQLEDEEPEAEPQPEQDTASGQSLQIVSYVFCIAGWVIVCIVFYFYRRKKNGRSNGTGTAEGFRSHADDLTDFDEEETLSQDRLSRLLNKPAFLIVLFCLYFSIPFLVHYHHLLNGESLVSGDGLTCGVIGQVYLGNSIRNFDFPLWTPFLAGGKPYALDVAMSAMYPLSWLCSLLPPLLQLYAYLGLHYAIGGVFLFLFLKKLRCAPFVSVAISTVYLFTVHMGGPRKEHVFLIVTALYVPVILYFLERYLQEKRLKWLLCGAAAMALQFYGGFLQYVVYSDLFMFFYLLCGGIRQKISVKQMLKHGVIWVAAYFGMIMACVLPLAQMLLLLTSSGGAEMSLEGFQQLSLHPAKLLMSVFPNLFGADVLSGLSEIGNYSSGVDAELVLGAAAVSAIFAGIALIRKNFYVRFMTISAVVTLGYACLGQSDLLARIEYHIPILNMFRVPSRTLFLFTFSCIVILALSADALYRSRAQEKRFDAAHIIVGVGMLGVIAVYYSVGIWPGVERQSFKQVFMFPIVIFLGYLAVFYAGKMLRNRGVISNKMRCNSAAAVLAVFTIIQMMPFYCISCYRSYNEIFAFPQEIKERIGTDKVIGIDISGSRLSFNEALALGVPALNAYTNFNLPNLYRYMMHSDCVPMNASEMYRYFLNALHTLQNDNDLLSMLGVRYIMTAPDRNAEAIAAVKEYEVETALIDESAAELLSAEGYQYAAWSAALMPDSYYHISLTVDAPVNGEQFYVDFAGNGYDNAEQETWFSLKEGMREYETILPSGDCGATDGVLFRIIALTQSDLKISNIKVEKIDPVLAFDYRLLLEEDEYNVYENLEAKPLVYAPKLVCPISEEEKQQLYLNTHDFDILNTSYLTNAEGTYDFSDANIRVSNIVLRNNSVSADIQADRDGFVNMSQTYYPGWNAYIDGQKTEVYEVNGLIQGAFVPAGTHTITFKFQPMVFYIGLAISLFSVSICLLCCFLDKKKHF